MFILHVYTECIFNSIHPLLFLVRVMLSLVRYAVMYSVGNAKNQIPPWAYPVWECLSLFNKMFPALANNRLILDMGNSVCCTKDCPTCSQSF